MDHTTHDPTPPEPRRFSIRLPHWGWLLLGTVLLAAGHAGLSVWLPYHREQQVVEKIHNWGGEVETDTGGPEWLRNRVGEDRLRDFKICERVIEVSLPSGTKVTDVDVASVTALSSLRRLALRGSTSVTDTGLAHLSECRRLESLHLIRMRVTGAGLPLMPNLTYLSLYETAVTDAGLARVSGLTNLRDLSLDGTAVTDAGLEHLRTLTNLEYLSLARTAVTDSGLTHLAGLPNLCDLSLDGAAGVTDAGLIHLSELTNLQLLCLSSTAVADSGLARLNGLTKLRELHLSNTKVTDAGLVHLRSLAVLRRLFIYGITVTDQGIEELKVALPDCDIRHLPP